jgi:hypothetical protein
MQALGRLDEHRLGGARKPFELRHGLAVLDGRCSLANPCINTSTVLQADPPGWPKSTSCRGGALMRSMHYRTVSDRGRSLPMWLPRTNRLAWIAWGP